MNNPKTKIENIVVQEFENEVLIYDLKIDKAFCLNQTSAMIWELCDGKHSVAEIAKLLNQKLNEPITEDLVWLALDGFKKDNLLEDEQFAINFGGLSRRQVIKKIGFASMVALPLISSVIAPQAAMAQSGLQALNASCTTNSQCQSGNCFMNTTCCVPGTVNGRAPGDQVGPNFGVPSVGDCAALTATECCSAQTTWFRTGNCYCG